MCSDTKRKQTGILSYLLAMSAACLIFAIMQGIHDNYGIMMNGIISKTDISYSSVSLVIAVGQILYGATQPFFGMLALKKSNAFVMLLGIVFMAAGLIATPFCREFWSLLLFFGIILPTGTGALCFGIVMGAVSPIIGEKRSATASGIIQASAGIGDALMSPALQHLTEWKGISVAMTAFSVPILLMLPIVMWLGLKNRQTKSELSVLTEKPEKNEKLITILRSAMSDSTYWRLLIGFTTCGFHMSIIETHLFSQYISNGLSGSTASFALTVYGTATMVGSVVTGFLGQKFRMKNVLAGVYGIRILISLAFIFIPITAPFAFIATGMLGLAGDSTVAPTTGIISRKVGVAKMAVVYGSIFIGHQIGAFVSAGLGGVLVNTSLGYTAIWIIDLCLCITAAIASYQIKD